MRSQRLWTPRVWNTLLPLVQGRARRKLRSGLQPYRRTSVISQGYLTRWIAHLRTSMMRPRCWTCLTCRTENLKPSNVGEMKDVFLLQEQTALKIAQSLNLKLSPQEQQAIQHRYTQNPQAYDAYLRGEALVQFSDQPEKVEAARRHFEEALQSDPDYAPALAGLAFVEGQTYRNSDANPSHLQRAEQFAQRALAIDPNLAETHLALGTVSADKYDYV